MPERCTVGKPYRSGESSRSSIWTTRRFQPPAGAARVDNPKSDHTLDQGIGKAPAPLPSRHTLDLPIGGPTEARRQGTCPPN